MKNIIKFALIFAVMFLASCASPVGIRSVFYITNVNVNGTVNDISESGQKGQSTLSAEKTTENSGNPVLGK